MLGLQADSQAAYERFVQRVVESGLVWALHSEEEGWCVSGSNDDEDVDVVPVWSDRAYAAQCARDEWAVYEPTPIPLNEFMEGWLPGMAEAGDLAGTNWNAQLIGREVEPLELLAALEARQRETASA